MFIELDFRVQVSLEVDSPSDYVATFVAVDDAELACIEDVQAELDMRISQEIGAALQEAAEMTYEAYLDRKDRVNELLR
uniref:Uncharacterized protein n=1 Tax=viral metagenome TaxID=1070528 RepID=A0A6M3LLC1_9ZZZZ